MAENRREAIRIRMYRVGFGDCFLLSFPSGGANQHVLIDCGVHASGNIGTLEAVVHNIAEETGGKLALIVATHAHQDHLSGFATYRDVFQQFEVREVWLPWTEDPADPDATRLRENHAALAQALTSHFAAVPVADKGRAAAIEAALRNLASNEDALRLLRSGVNGGKVKYLAAGRQIRRVAGIAGLSARILGPPREEQYLARMDPPADERFLRAASEGGVVPVNGIVPFDSRWRVDQASHKYYAAITERDKNLLAVAATSAEILAFALDEALNNTSIVALFTFRGRNLLFAGDAQYGVWQSWLEKPDARSLLHGVNFYKVSHHGSVNATPRSVLEGMSEKGFAAMVSTQSRPWPSIPRVPLMEALAAKATAAVRSDSVPVEGAPEGPPADPMPNGVSRGELWFDYLLPC